MKTLAVIFCITIVALLSYSVYMQQSAKPQEVVYAQSVMEYNPSPMEVISIVKEMVENGELDVFHMSGSIQMSPDTCQTCLKKTFEVAGEFDPEYGQTSWGTKPILQNINGEWFEVDKEKGIVKSIY